MNKIIKHVAIALVILNSIQLCAVPNIISDRFNGDWYGELSIGTVKLPIVFHISSTNVELTSTMDSPSQGALGIPMGETTFSDRNLVISASGLGIRYEAELKDSKHLVGIFKQSGQELELVLTKTKLVKKKLKSQSPKPPFNYTIETIRFKNIGAGIKLEGTLTIPKLS